MEWVSKRVVEAGGGEVKRRIREDCRRRTLTELISIVREFAHELGDLG